MKNKVASLRNSFDQVSPSFRDKAYMGEAVVGIQAS